MTLRQQHSPTFSFHENLVEAVLSALQAIFVQNGYADKVIEKTLRSNKKWGSRDRAFIAETAYNIVRNYRLLCETMGNMPRNIGDWQRIIHIWFSLQNLALPTTTWRNWIAFTPAEQDHARRRANFLQKTRKIAYSLPNWMDSLAEQQLGSLWDSLAPALHQTAPLHIRTNELMLTPQSLHQQLIQRGIDNTLKGEAVIEVQKRQNLFQLDLFQQGYFEVQDKGSQQIAPFLQADMGMRIVDACAGAGGKTLHLAALMHNQGRIIALDTINWKLEELQKRARRAGATIVETRWIENAKTIKRLYNTADRLLLDVPCSGLGVLRRNPDAKWKLTPAFIAEIIETQQQILTQYSPICKVGGKIVYATCSILPDENERQVAQFLAQAPQFRLESEQTLLPTNDDTDGFYMARMVRIY